jgi:hypothetical protein
MIGGTALKEEEANEYWWQLAISTPVTKDPYKKKLWG